MTENQKCRRLNILFVTPWYPSPGNQANGIFVREHAQAVARYHNVAILHSAGQSGGRARACEVAEETEPEFTEGLLTYRMYHPRAVLPKTGHLGRLVCLQMATRTISTRGFQPDVIHANIHRVALLSVILGKLRRIPVVITEHSSAFPRALVNSRDIFEARIAFRHAHTVMPVSHVLQQSIESYGITGNFYVVPNVVDTERFHPDGSRSRGGSRLLCVANMPESEVKGYPYLIQALAHLDPSLGWSLDIIGDGPMRESYQRQAAALGLGDRISFLGYRPKAEIVQAMQRADLFVLASVWDNMPCVLLEAMASGLPICATRVGGIPEIVDEQVGMLAEPGNAADLARTLTAMLASIGRYQPADIAALAQSRYGMTAVGRRLDAVYRQALGSTDCRAD